MSDSRGHIRWEVAQRELASTGNLFLSAQEKKEALKNINQQENETKKDVQFKGSTDVFALAFDHPFGQQLKVFFQSIFRAYSKLCFVFCISICCYLDVRNQTGHV